MVFNNNNFSDYGSGSSINLSDSEQSLFSKGQGYGNGTLHTPKALSVMDVVKGRHTIDDVMQEFKMNGFDSPYNPDDEDFASNTRNNLSGMGPASGYLRQRSWPAVDRSAAPSSAPRVSSRPLSLHASPSPPAPRPLSLHASPSPPAPRPLSLHAPPSSSVVDFNFATQATTAEASCYMAASARGSATVSASDLVTGEQRRVLNSLPNAVVHALLRDMQKERNAARSARGFSEQLCRFCRNNGERELYYRTHQLRDDLGRVTCPVLRAFLCKRCGATGDNAHTSKYCPLTTPDERKKSALMMRSVRLASGRRRNANREYVLFGDANPASICDNLVYENVIDEAPLDPLWAALEQKLRM